MVPNIGTGSNTRGLLAYLYGPGRRDEHIDPHIVGAWATLGLPDPGRDENATLTALARYLDQPVNLRAREIGRPVPKHVWHCSVRTAPEDRYLSDAEWGEIARRIVHATGIAPDGDDQGCRWIAVRHADDHIHILATTVREDGRRPKRHNDALHAQAECRKIEKELGLRRLKSGDGTAGKRPTQAERSKAHREGWAEPSREWLRNRVREAIPHSATVEELLAYLQAAGVQVKIRTGPSGDALGYSLGRPGDLTKDGEQVWYPGGKLAPDLSLPQLRARLTTAPPPAEHPTARRNRPDTPWQQATDALDAFPTALTGGDDTQAQAHITALGELIDATTHAAPDHLRADLRTAARAFARATRSRVRADHTSAATLRTAARSLAHLTTSGKDGTAASVLLAAIIWAAILTARWHEARGHAQQTAAARQSLHHLQAAYDQAIAHPLAKLSERQPASSIQQALAHDVRAAIPDHADRILTDPHWPALATVLTDAEAGGHPPRHLLQEAAEQRELHTAHSPARVLLSRIQHTARNPAPNPRAEAARRRTTVTTHQRSIPANIPGPVSPTPPAAMDVSRAQRR
ncbi:relaxase/mobilization nuclease domain-containing protein [Allostreptomyces psammosilenae]|uniref:MobA/VirD2-like nuclease domain-containing protein n=1 Tax=Allostreptomyces psammosilenae TaxID=1892865 RepID=A0A852ZXV4_9ACTN|nr:mobilization protein [Allostreptomyces psammosilenae]NYI05554.1 hypothetical protein [Allostreptomyces psammosilenae]